MKQHIFQKIRASSAFTIVELVVVITTIAIISTIIIISYSAVTDQAREKAALAELQSAYGSLSFWSLKHAGVAASSLSAAGVEQPGNVTLAYYTYGNDLKYCISARVDEDTAFYRLSDASGSPKEGSCDDPDWVAGAPLAFNDTPGTVVELSTPISGTPNITLYTVFSVVDASLAWPSLGGLAPSAENNRFYFQGSSADSTSASYRIDTSVEVNLGGIQADVRTPGYHIGWLQTSSNGTIRQQAYDKTAFHTLASHSPHAGWNFTQLFTPAVGSSYSGVGTLVYDEAHDQTTRQKVMNWLAQRFETGQSF
ncbi:hypothetical protein GW930_00970 [Candidatus Saccharibacteria bacterium]|nr:hypothetical protein [Candidatus Saccharibacteria bacterium]